MKTKMKFYVMTLLMLFVSMSTFAMVQEIPEVDLTNTSVLIAIATPIVVYFVTFVLKKFISQINGMYTIALTLLLAGIFTWLTNSMAEGNLSWFLQLLLGLVAVAVDQAYKILSNNNKKR